MRIQWMSPENIFFNEFTVESNVWSFGIILWEIYTSAAIPYDGKSNEEVSTTYRLIPY